MRHNKLAGNSKFLLGKDLVYSRKRRASNNSATKLNTFTNRSFAGKHLLHSKSTYFYNKFSSSRLGDGGLSSSFIRLAPFCCGVALCLGIGLALNPIYGEGSGKAYAANDDKCKTTVADSLGNCAMELGIFMNGTDSAFNELPATELSTDSVVHRDYSFSIRAVDTKDGYDLYAGVVNTGSFGNSLVNADYPTEEYMIKAISGTDVAYSNIGNNEWGYALTSTNQTAEELNYNSLPATTITMENNQTILTSGKLIAHGEDTGYDPSQPVGEDKHTDQDYKLYFAAKASPESPSGHYRTQVMLSLIANPKQVVVGLGPITKMSEMTSTYCASLKTPAANADLKDIPTGQLIDDREDPVTGTKYWVAKLADGNCWMTQNMAYSGVSNKTGRYSEENKNKVLDQNKSISGSFTIDIGTRVPSNDSSTMAVFPDDTTYNAHLRIGNYYTRDNEQAADTCNFSSKNNSDWKLPTSMSGNASNGSFRYLTNSYGLTSGSDVTAGDASIILRAPFFFLRSGNCGYSDSPVDVGETGIYWGSSSVYGFWITGNSFHTSSHNYGTAGGYSVRCLVLGS